MLIFSYFYQWVRYLYNRLFTFDVNRVSACPSCGLIGVKKQKFSLPYQRLVLGCPRCNAMWAIAPVVPYSVWAVKGIEEVAIEEQAVEDEKVANREIDLLGIKR
jgi:hypothetical protein